MNWNDLKYLKEGIITVLDKLLNILDPQISSQLEILKTKLSRESKDSSFDFYIQAQKVSFRRPTSALNLSLTSSKPSPPHNLKPPQFPIEYIRKSIAKGQAEFKNNTQSFAQLYNVTSDTQSRYISREEYKKIVDCQKSMEQSNLRQISLGVQPTSPFRPYQRRQIDPMPILKRVTTHRDLES